MLRVSLSLICSLHICFLVLLGLSCGEEIGQAANIIPLGSNLTPTLTTGWASSKGTFLLTFYPVTVESNSSPSTYSVGVLYGLVSKQTAAWTAGGDHVQVQGAGASFELTSDGNLVLLSHAHASSSAALVWSSSTAHRNVTGAEMREDGNFVLYGESGAIVWQSFDSPTHTLVPNQPLKAGQSLQNGPYVATMDANGNFSIVWRNGSSSSISYWSSHTSENSAAGSAAPYAVLKTDGIFSVIDGQGADVKSWASNDFNDSPVPSVRRLTLDADGNLRIYSWFTGGTDWSIGWVALDQCEVYGYCGDRGLCTYNSGGPGCICVEQAGYTFVDPSNPRRGCKASVPGAAGSNCTTGMVMVQFDHTLLFSLDGVMLNNGETNCNTTCLQNPPCVAATSYNDGSKLCFLSIGGTSFSGYQGPSIPSNSFFKFCGTVPPTSSAAAPPSSASTSSKFTILLVIIVSAVATLGIVLLAQAGLWFCYCRKNPIFGRCSSAYPLFEDACGAPVQFTYKELRSATQNFREKLGEGGFGAVYKGSLPTRPTTTEVAVKRLRSAEEQSGEKQFRTGVAIIGSTHHVNLVRLCGFCAESKHRLLVHEYMPNGSLDRYLFDDGGGSRRNLDWPTRFNILVGTARGIRYLHQGCRDCIIHCDIKPENILLDENFCAKVSDFGLAKIANARDRAHNNHHVSMLVGGTRGYLAPEWRSNLPITVKLDVYSFGMVVLETVSGRKSFDFSSSSIDSPARQGQSFSEWAFQRCFEGKQLQSVVDARLLQSTEQQLDMAEVDRALKVAFCCMQVQPSSRPSMSRVIQMLQGTLPVGTPTSHMPQLLGGFYTNEENLRDSLEQEQLTASSSLRTTSLGVGDIAQNLSRSLLTKETSQTTSSSSPPSLSLPFYAS